MTLQELMSFDSSDASNSASNITNGTISPLNHHQSETHAKMQFELEKQKLMLEIANQKITTQAFEIEKLTKIIAIMKDEIKVLKGQ
jgi:hypothetical protein